MKKFESEKNVRFDFGQDIMPEPPQKFLKYIYQKDNGDWDYCVDEDSIDEDTKDDIESWYRYFVDYAYFLTNGYDKEVSEKEKNSMHFFHSFSTAENIYPPAYISKYIYKKRNGDYSLKSKNVTDYIKKEFDIWHNYFLCSLILLRKSSINFYNDMKYDDIWDERGDAMYDALEDSKFRDDYIYERYLGMILPSKNMDDMSIEKLKDYIKYAKISRQTWKSVVQKQKTNKIIPSDFDEKNMEKLCMFYDNIHKDDSEERIEELLNNMILNAEDILKEKENA